MIAKFVSIKDAGGKSSGRVLKAVELIAGDLSEVRKAQTVRASSRTGGIAPANQLPLSFAGQKTVNPKRKPAERRSPCGEPDSNLTARQESTH